MESVLLNFQNTTKVGVDNPNSTHDNFCGFPVQIHTDVQLALVENTTTLNEPDWRAHSCSILLQQLSVNTCIMYLYIQVPRQG